MMGLFHFLRTTVIIPRFPLYGKQVPGGLNFHLTEELLAGIQARCYLYIMCPEGN